ncbi:Lysophosphatidylcholine acyltransferase [Fusarium oxysporum f. sp. albedinis]|nr:Lysophosphatidylcholine acyltransferase [Fusarium oxysporum f. sp. albedinis]
MKAKESPVPKSEDSTDYSPRVSRQVLYSVMGPPVLQPRLQSRHHRARLLGCGVSEPSFSTSDQSPSILRLI